MACPLKNLLFFLFTFLPFPTTAQTYRNISLDSSLTAVKDGNPSWLSPSGEFAFGFRKIAKDGFLLAIWFDEIPDKTIVWSANRDNLVPKGSKVELTIDGEFMLNGKRIRDTESAGTGVAYASMLNTGNFVLADQSSSNVWESFNYPTDTILPSQTLNQNGILYARYTATNYSTGRFLFSLQPDGNLVLATTKFPQNTPNEAYWSVQNPNIGFRFIFNESCFMYVTSQNGSLLSYISSNMVSMQDFYQRATLEYDGVFRHYVYPKSTSSSARRWPMVWSTSSFVPPYICTSIMESTGGGACGLNSFCTIENQGPTCQCPNGYSFTDPEDERGGCKQNFAPQSCGETSKEETDLFEFQELKNANCWGGDYALFEGVSEDWCRQNCLDDCFCAAAVYNSAGQCWKKRLPFSNGAIDPNNTGKTLIKFGKQNSTVKWGTNTEKKDDKTLILFGSVILSGSGVLNFLLPLITYLVVSRAYSRKAKECQPYPVISGMNLKHFTYEELNNATNQFEEELGRGASAIVFKGVLASDNGKSVAVKSLDTRVRENELEVKAEVSAIGRTNHRNLVQLLGFCYEGEHRILVYEFMSNGSLAGFLFGEPMRNWYQRRKIALEIARGLLYLHEECSSQIVHCDIKPQNILLDDSLTARISDFGLAKLLRIDQTITTTGIRGTKGYVAPEWWKRLPITAKVDIYSYGILLLEIIFCRMHFEAAVEDDGQMILADWAYDCYKQNKLHQLFKDNDEAMHDMKMVEKYVMIAIWCIQEDPSLRPTIKKVTLMLEGTVEVSAPPGPSSFISSIL